MRRLVALVLPALTFAPAASLCGQAPAVLDSAARVRVTAPAWGLRTQTATVIAHARDTLWIRSLPRGETVAVAVRDLTRVEVSRGRRGHGLRGAGIGLVAGAAVGAGLGYAFRSDPDRENCVYCGNREMDVAAGALVGGAAGALAGAIIGANHRTERWQPVIVASPAVSARPGASAIGRFGVGIRLGF